jgi:hypothetical protein
VTLRGYTPGNYLAENYSHVDLDARFQLRGKFGAAVFADRPMNCGQASAQISLSGQAASIGCWPCATARDAPFGAI